MQVCMQLIGGHYMAKTAGHHVAQGWPQFTEKAVAWSATACTGQMHAVVKQPARGLSRRIFIALTVLFIYI
jgi:hypothetical protein